MTRIMSTPEFGQTIWLRFNESHRRTGLQPYSSPGKAYLSKEEYEEETALNGAWDKLQVYVRNNYRCPSNATLAEVKAACEALRIP